MDSKTNPVLDQYDIYVICRTLLPKLLEIVPTMGRTSNCLLELTREEPGWLVAYDLAGP